MNDLINRRDAVSRVSDLLILDLKGERLPTWNEVYRAINDIPPAPKMKPIFYSDGYADGNPVYDFATCPRCEYQYEDTDKAWGEPFCPHCGTRLMWDEVI